MPVEWKISAGLSAYEPTIALMEELVAEIYAQTAPELVWMLEYPPLYTAGTSAKKNDLLEPDKFPVFMAGRGGEFTYHGPGQRVAYVMLNLKERNAEDVRLYVSNLEQWIINSLARFDIKGLRREKRIGIWVDMAGGEAKIAAIGIRIRKWVTYYGVSINLAPDLSHFAGIVPCGIANYGVTSLARLGRDISMKDLDIVLKEEFGKIFP